jgi:hypothetical protein
MATANKLETGWQRRTSLWPGVVRQHQQLPRPVLHKVPWRGESGQV